jgi:hypothetical protein
MNPNELDIHRGILPQLTCAKVRSSGTGRHRASHRCGQCAEPPARGLYYACLGRH